VRISLHPNWPNFEYEKVLNVKNSVTRISKPITVFPPIVRNTALTENKYNNYYVIYVATDFISTLKMFYNFYVIFQ